MQRLHWFLNDYKLSPLWITFWVFFLFWITKAHHFCELSSTVAQIKRLLDTKLPSRLVWDWHMPIKWSELDHVFRQKKKRTTTSIQGTPKSFIYRETKTASIQKRLFKLSIRISYKMKLNCFLGLRLCQEFQMVFL